MITGSEFAICKFWTLTRLIATADEIIKDASFRFSGAFGLKVASRTFGLEYFTLLLAFLRHFRSLLTEQHKGTFCTRNTVHVNDGLFLYNVRFRCMLLHFNRKPIAFQCPGRASPQNPQTTCKTSRLFCNFFRIMFCNFTDLGIRSKILHIRKSSGKVNKVMMARAICCV